MIINLPAPVTGEYLVCGTPVTTTFNRLSPTGTPGEYELQWVLDNGGKDQVTSNGTTSLSHAQVEAIKAAAEAAAAAAVPPPEDPVPPAE